MSIVTPVTSAAFTPFTARTRADATTPAQPVPETKPAPAAQIVEPPVSRQLRIEFDKDSARFVQTLLADDTVLRRYPDEAQLAFSRGICAYEEARRRA